LAVPDLENGRHRARHFAANLARRCWRVTGFVRALSPASRRLRFHVALNELSEATLKALTCVDQRGHVAFVLTVTEHGTERIVGEARYAVSSDRETAEFGIAVADAFQGLGVLSS
jgi:hypothetical protein